MSAPRVVIDDSKWPRVHATWPGEPLADREFEEMVQLIASVVTAINWITPSPSPQKIFSSLADAEAWATAQLESRRER